MRLSIIGYGQVKTGKNTEMKVYIVLYFESDDKDSEIFGVFTSKEKAMDELKKREISSYCFSIEEVFMDRVLI